MDDLPVYETLLTLLDNADPQAGIVIDGATCLQLASDLRAARSTDRGRLSAAHQVQDRLVDRIDQLKAELHVANEREAARTQARLDAAMAHRNRWSIVFGRRRGDKHG